jgi:hypothetical protein
MAPWPRDPPLAEETLFTTRRRNATSLELHLVRPAGPAACLRRRHQTNRSAFHRIDPGLAARASCDRACGLNSRRSHPTPCRVPRAAPPPSRVGWSLHAIPSAAEHALRRPRRPREKMPLTDFCNRLHATSTPTDPSIPELASRAPLRARFVTTPDRACGTAWTRVELRLTAILQLR